MFMHYGSMECTYIHVCVCVCMYVLSIVSSGTQSAYTLSLFNFLYQYTPLLNLRPFVFGFNCHH
jgi:hypothetical protein